MSAVPEFSPEIEIQAVGRELVRSLQVSLRTVRSHGWSNEASRQAIEALEQSANRLWLDRGDFRLRAASDFVFIDDERLKVDASGHGVFEALIRELTGRAVGEVIFLGVVTRTQLEGLLECLLSVTEDESAGDPIALIERLNSTLEARAIPLQVAEVRDGEIPQDDVDRKERAKKAFFKAVTVARALFTSTHLNRRLDLRHAKRVVHTMVDLMIEEEFTLLGLTTLKDYDNYTFYHSVNVCIYSLAMGKRLGLSRNQLSELGVAAMLHDIGKTQVPVTVLRKRGQLNRDEVAVMTRHPEMGVRELVKMKGLSSLAFKSMVAAFEHHLSYNPKLPGYPRLRSPFRPHLIGRIVALADCFDAMTTKRCYTPKAVTRDKALAFMLAQGGQKFDPTLVKLFANLIGVFPVGTLVRLRSGRLAVVTSAAEDPSLCHRPTVKPITNAQGIEIDLPEMDLSVPGPDGAVPDEIQEAVDEESIGLDIAKYFA